MTQRYTPGQTTQQIAMSDWRHIIQSLYPDLDHRTYCVPPVYFNRVPYERVDVAGQPVLVTCQPVNSILPYQSTSASQTTSPGQSLSSSKSPGDPATVHESDTRDDFAQQHVLQCLQKLGEKQQEPMFVISQLNYADYLNKPSYAQAAQQLPRPVDLPQQDTRGDFDVLIIRLHYGVIIGEIKSVGLKDGELNITQAQSDAAVTKRVGNAVKQLNKSERVIKHLVSDIAPGLSVNKTIILPYVTSSQLQRVLCADRQLEQAVCQSVGAKDVADAVQLCLCADQLSSRATPYDVTPATLSALTSWLQKRTSRDPQMSRDVYIDVLARIVGPATSICVHCVTLPRVEVRTLGEAVSELGDRLARVVLTPQQLDLLNRAPGLPMVCLVGPPGTGKSLVLVLVGLHWLRAGHDVLVVSTDYTALAVSRLVYHQLETTLREDPTTPSSAGTVYFLQFDLNDDETDEEEVIESLMTTTTRHTLHVIMDEAGFDHSKIGPRLHRTVTRLSARVPGLRLWAATMWNENIPPGLQVEPLTVPLRCSPVIVREFAEGLKESAIHNYSTSSTPSPSDGPSVMRLRHEGGQHSGRWPVECGQCGREVADVLRQLQVGVPINDLDTNTSSNNPNTTSGNTTTSPPPLRYRDVLVLTRSEELHDDVRDDEGILTSPACDFVSELRAAGIPVCVISDEDDDAKVERGMADVAVARSDHVTVANYHATFGLERKLTITLPGMDHNYDMGRSREDIVATDRLYAVSRCSTQLVVVHVPDNAYDDDQGNKTEENQDDQHCRCSTTN